MEISNAGPRTRLPPGVVNPHGLATILTRKHPGTVGGDLGLGPEQREGWTDDRHGPPVTIFGVREA